VGDVGLPALVGLSGLEPDVAAVIDVRSTDDGLDSYRYGVGTTKAYRCRPCRSGSVARASASGGRPVSVVRILLGLERAAGVVRQTDLHAGSAPPG
jgi:hypothetical protein